VLTARSGEEALEVLKEIPVDLIVTDIRMPGISGLDLLVEVRKNYPATGVIVMTAFPTPEYKKDAVFKGSLHFIEKPFDINELRKVVRHALESERGFRGTVTGIELTDLLQINCLSRTTAALRVRTQEREGIIFFKDGRVVHAIYEDKEGEEAFYAILQFEGGTLESLKGAEAPAVTIERGWESLLMEGLRRLDEAKRDRSSLEAGGMPEGKEVSSAAEGNGAGGKKRLSPDQQKEEDMALENYLKDFKEIKGYKAAGIMNFTGEMLAYDSVDKNIDLGIVGATFNDIFRSAHEASEKIGLDACRETVINTPKGVICMRCSGVDSKAHFHQIGILASDGNQALMKMQMEKVEPQIMNELA